MSTKSKNRTPSGKSVPFAEIKSWPEPVNGTDLLDDLAACVRRYVVLSKHEANAFALWVVFTYLIDVVNFSPVLALLSPEKRCGKTTVLALLNRLVHRAMSCANITPAPLFRVIEEWQPTLLIDEADTFLNNSDELRGMLNSGHTRETARVLRCVGDDHETRWFSTWGAKAIAKIGGLPDTLHDRSIVINLRRKLPHEDTEKLCYADPTYFDALRQKCARFAQDIARSVKGARPNIPDALHDRAADNWEPLLAIADQAGGDWPVKAREAAFALSAETSDQDDSRRVLLLGDIRDVFASKNLDRLTSEELIGALGEMENRPWGEYRRVQYGYKPISPRQLSQLLKGFGIAPKDIRIGERGGLKGYELEQFEDAFSRYLTPQQPRQRYKQASARDSEASTSATDPLSRNEKPSEAASTKGCSAVAPDAGVMLGGNADANEDDPAMEGLWM